MEMSEVEIKLVVFIVILFELVIGVKLAFRQLDRVEVLG